MAIDEHSIVGDLVAEHYPFSDIFYRHDIDFCCGGDISVGEACTKMNYSNEQKMALIDELNCVKTTDVPETLDVNLWSLSFMVDYIQEKHHKYAEENASMIQQYLNKIAMVHGTRHPELLKVASLFNEAIDDLIPHMKREELVLFPNVKRLENLDTSSDTDAEEIAAKFSEVLEQLSLQHDHEGELFREIAILTNNFTLPADACTTYTVAFQKLKEFESDLHRHIHLENNILFKKIREKFQPKVA